MPAGRQRTAYSLDDAVKEISKKYLDAYHEDMDLLAIARPDKEPLATKYIPKMVKFIELLIERGCAYESAGDVYFDIKKAKDYGKLSNQNIDKMEVGARPVRGDAFNGTRIAPGKKKKDPLDFALWKKAKEGEPSWKSPWGEGRPGWHIECSAMSSDILGDEFDIHGGGIDLIFPHHENEIAQSEGAGKAFAKYWIHNGLLTINNKDDNSNYNTNIYGNADYYAYGYAEHNADLYYNCKSNLYDNEHWHVYHNGNADIYDN